MAKILLVDDETRFRTSLAGRLRRRGFDILDVDSGEEAIKATRRDDAVEIAVIDLKMPGMDGIQTLRELKAVRPTLQAIMLTGHGTMESAKDAGRHDAFRYLEKPCDVEEVVQALEAATEEVGYARARHEIPRPVEGRSLWKRLIGSHNSRPGFIILGLAIFAGVVYGPTPARLVHLLSAPKSAPGAVTAGHDEIMGYASYREMTPGQTVANYYGRKYKLEETTATPDGGTAKAALSPEGAAFRAKVMLGVILIGALFWASGAVPVAVTTFFVALALYLYDVFKPDQIAQAFAKDAVIFIFGVLALAKAITKTGLDRRIGLLLLGPAKNLPLLLLVFLPMFSVACSFISEHALVAFTVPLFVMVYASAIKTAGLKRDRMLMVMFALALAFAANSGGPGSPAAGGRNAIMVGILADYGIAPTFGQWMQYGMPFVPVMSIVIGLYFLLFVRPKALIKTLNVSAEVRRAADKIGPMTRDEYVTATIFGLVVLLWVTCSGWLGMGGPVLVGLVLLNVFRVLSWKDMQGIHWEVVLLYAGACAIGSGLAATGAALYMADAFVALLPEFLSAGSGLAIASSLFTGITTNFMSDGATVAAIGPVTVPMATVAGTHPWMVGLTTAFASSFAHMLIIGTPSNALAYAMAKDPETGEQLVTLGDFMKHGFVVLLLSFVVLWGWTILGYWRWIGFPAV
ncbi:MAG: SLC13 family permease [Gemmatimonadota bacterium]|nr:SLC13 family permease [Gemmatimonadota bacterium]MDH4349976.1 SLC13 family permease [Gemmatimonadota bacterium]MDH5195676.1 SLC13 family permease [Gemmatimonadota bacterium]